jgi:hypothetical protein
MSMSRPSVCAVPHFEALDEVGRRIPRARVEVERAARARYASFVDKRVARERGEVTSGARVHIDAIGAEARRRRVARPSAGGVVDAGVARSAWDRMHPGCDARLRGCADGQDQHARGRDGQMHGRSWEKGCLQECHCARRQLRRYPPSAICSTTYEPEPTGEIGASVLHAPCSNTSSLQLPSSFGRMRSGMRAARRKHRSMRCSKTSADIPFGRG